MANPNKLVDGVLVPMTDAEWAAWQTMPQPVLPLTLTFEAFMGLFTLAEQTAILDSSDIGVRLWLLKGTSASFINFGDPQVKQSLDYLVSKGLLIAGREAQILANQPPS